MIYDDVENGLRTAFAHIENARNSVNIRKDLEGAKKEFKTAYQEIFRLMGILKKQKNRYPGLEKTYDELLVLHDRTLFDAIRNIHNFSGIELIAVCQIIERTIAEEIARMDSLKKKKAAA
jgi:vacuolar-type H+-ATPase subunit F/Vma7